MGRSDKSFVNLTGNNSRLAPVKATITLSFSFSHVVDVCNIDEVFPYTTT